MKTHSAAIFGIVLACGLALPGCASRSRAKSPVQTAAYAAAQSRIQGAYTGMQPPEPFQIIDYQDRAKEGKIPEWVDSYLAEGIRGVENIPEFQNKYVFIGLSEGVNFNALSQWEEAFSPAQDLARLIAFRIGARFTTAVQSDPDDTYGEFFETMIKGASDAQYQGAVKETGFWILRLSPAKETDEESEEQEVNREVYDFLVLISIDKKQLESQINAIFNAAKENINPRKDQAAAINRIGENFFEGF